MGSHCSPRLDTSRYLFSTDISFLRERRIWRKQEIGTGKREIKIIQSELSFLFYVPTGLGKLITDFIFHFHRAERQSATG